jgi:hypothetical protein
MYHTDAATNSLSPAISGYHIPNHREAHPKASAREMQPNAEGKLTEDIVATDDCKHPQKIQIQQHSFMGMLWCAAWLFTIGYLHLNFWRGLLAIVLWPYYIGVHFSALTH